MKDEALIKKIIDMGAFKAGFVKVEKVELLEEFRKYCESNSCGKYGKSYMCPPDAGTIHALMKSLKTYKTALVYQTVTELEDSYDFEGMTEAGNAANKMAQDFSIWLKENGYSDFLHLGSGGCKVCETCGKETNVPCRFPDKAMASLETYGVNVSQLATLADMKYINGQDTVTYFCAVFFR